MLLNCLIYLRNNLHQPLQLGLAITRLSHGQPHIPVHSQIDQILSQEALTRSRSQFRRLACAFLKSVICPSSFRVVIDPLA